LSDTSIRSIVKTVGWRITGSLSTFAISYVVLGNFIIAGSIALIQVTANTILYFCHERIWNQIRWGQRNFQDR
jgi:uncharacterized membrane protein